MKTIDDLHQLLEFLIHCVDLEVLGGLELAQKQIGQKLIAPWEDTESLFFPNAAEIVLEAATGTAKGFFQNLFKADTGSQRLYYGYPLHANERGYLSPLFFIAVDISEQNGHYKIHPVWNSLSVNRQILQKTLSREEADALVRDLEGDFGSFDARLKLAAEALDIPQTVLNPDALRPLSNAANSPGWHNTPILFLANVSHAKRGLRFELKHLQKSYCLNHVGETSLGTFLGLSEPPATRPVLDRHEISPLNPQQAEAVDRALSTPLTVITGPPGTGKSQVVVNILSNCVTSGQTVLFASNNNKPLEEVQQRLAKTMGQAGDWSLRLGNKDSRKLAKETVLPRVSDTVETDTHYAANEIRRHLLDLALERGMLEQERDTIAELQDTIEKALGRENRATSVIPQGGIEAFANALPPALDETRLSKALRNLSLLKGETDGGLLFWIQRLLFGQRLVGNLEDTVRDLYADMPKPLKDAAFDGYARCTLDDLDRALAYLRNVMQWRNARMERHDAERRLQNCRPIADIERDLNGVSQKRIRASGDVLRTTWRERIATRQTDVKDALKRYFEYLDRLEQGAGKNRAFFQPFEQCAKCVMDGLPVWMVTNLSAAASIPRVPALFDCVVIDEASQSDFASIIPLLYRARRAVLVGDPKQLPHIPGITPKQEDRIATELDVGGMAVEFSPVQRSAYDLGASAAARRGEDEILLSQHYRCHPEIIGFSNAAFYDGRLISRHSGQNPSELPQGGIHWHDIKGRLEKTHRSAVNVAEAEAVVDMIESWLPLLQDEGGTLWTIGVVTPFRKQVSRIVELLEERPWFTQVAPRLTIGTTHTFQGSECDVMIFSPVVTNGMENFLIGFAAHQDELLNVAVTRAQSALYVLGDKLSCRAAGGALGKLEQYVTNGGSFSSPRPSQPSEAEHIFATILTELGIAFEQEYEVVRKDGAAPYRLDFMVISNSGRRYDLEVDGDFHLGNDRFQEDSVRNKFVESKGFEVLRFRARDVLQDADKVKERLRRLV